MDDEQSKQPELTTVQIEHGLLRAQVIKAKLESVGIPVLLKYESLGPIYGITVDGLGEVQILVPNERAAEARSLLEAPKEDERQPLP